MNLLGIYVLSTGFRNTYFFDIPNSSRMALT